MANLVSGSRDEAERRAQTADAAIAAGGVRGDVEPIVCSYHAVSRQIGALLRPGRAGSVPDLTADDALEGTLFPADTAALVCPVGTGTVGTETVLVAWNGSRQALRVVRRAMPFLKRAKTAEVVMVDASPDDPEPGQQVATMLARHGVSVDISIAPLSSERVSAILRRRVIELGAGLLVMGAYGHSRFREYMFGGVTGEILNETPVPVLLAH